MVIAVIKDLLIRVRLVFQPIQCGCKLTCRCFRILTVQHLQSLLYGFLQNSAFLQLQEMIVTDTDRFPDRFLQLLPGIIHFPHIVFIIGVYVCLSSDRFRWIKLLKAVLASAPALIAKLCPIRVYKVVELFFHLSIFIGIIFVTRRFIAAHLKVITVSVLDRQRNLVHKVYTVRTVIYHHIAAASLCRKCI